MTTGWRHILTRKKEQKSDKGIFSSPLKACDKSKLVFLLRQQSMLQSYLLIICAGEEITLIALPMLEKSFFGAGQGFRVKSIFSRMCSPETFKCSKRMYWSCSDGGRGEKRERNGQ